MSTHAMFQCQQICPATVSPLLVCDLIRWCLTRQRRHIAQNEVQHAPGRRCRIARYLYYHTPACMPTIGHFAMALEESQTQFETCHVAGRVIRGRFRDSMLSRARREAVTSPAADPKCCRMAYAYGKSSRACSDRRG